MSTKNSLYYKDLPPKSPPYIHIYKDGLDDKYYIETNEGVLEIPDPKIAIIMARSLSKHVGSD